MKRILVILLTAVLLLSFSACGKDYRQKDYITAAELKSYLAEEKIELAPTDYSYSFKYEQKAEIDSGEQSRKYNYSLKGDVVVSKFSTEKTVSGKLKATSADYIHGEKQKTTSTIKEKTVVVFNERLGSYDYYIDSTKKVGGDKTSGKEEIKSVFNNSYDSEFISLIPSLDRATEYIDIASATFLRGDKLTVIYSRSNRHIVVNILFKDGKYKKIEVKEIYSSGSERRVTEYVMDFLKGEDDISAPKNVDDYKDER